MRMLLMTGGKDTRTSMTHNGTNTDIQWESSDNNGHDYDVEDTYATEAVREEQDIADDQNQDESEDYDEDDQDKYM